jgi:hypothetical protein
MMESFTILFVVLITKVRLGSVVAFYNYETMRQQLLAATATYDDDDDKKD